MSDIGSNYDRHSVVILLDECGDMGRSPNSSRSFVVAAMVVRDPNELVRLLKNARKRLGRRDWKGELKFNNMADPIREFILEGIANLDCQIAWVAFEKNKLPSTLQTNKHFLYLAACKTVLRELFIRTPSRKIYVVMDKYYSKKEERDRLEQHVQTLLVEGHAGYFVPQLEVSQYDSLSRKDLQVHDFVVGAIFQHVERNVDTYINIIKDKIIFGKEL